MVELEVVVAVVGKDKMKILGRQDSVLVVVVVVDFRIYLRIIRTLLQTHRKYVIHK